MNDRWFKYISISTITIWLLILALLPFAMLVIASFLKQGSANFFEYHFSLASYAQLFHWVYLRIFCRSLSMAILATVICLLIGYPFAYVIAKAPEKFRMIFVFLIIIPFWTSSLIRTYAIITLIKAHGLLNQFLMWFGVIHHPIQILYTQLASQIGLVYTLIPFMILPIYTSLEKFDWHLVDAARDLGASKWRAFWRVVVPMSVPGILSGVLLVLLPAMTLFYIPDILGGAKSILLGNVIKDSFLESLNWPLGSSISVALTIFMVLLLLVYRRFTSVKERRAML